MAEPLSYWDRACDYADGVVAGDIVAGEYVRLACERFLRDGKRTDLIAHDDGNRWCSFLERLPHVKGKWAASKQRLTLSDWQIFCVVNLYGWKWADSGLRRFREGYIEVPRKNGKSLLMGGLGLGHLTIDNEHGAEVYCGATTEKQAWEVFRPARQIAARTEALRRRFGMTVHARALTRFETDSRFEPVIGDPGDGSSPSCAIADEFHEHKNSDQVDTFSTGMGAREQPMMLYITTAGSDMGGPCYAKRADVIDILRGSVDDDLVFGVIYGLDNDDEWDTVEAQRKANPNYGISVDSGFLAGQLAQAKRSATRQTAYRTKHLNQWVGARNAWMNMLAFQACRKRDLALDSYAGARCWFGVDLASKLDLACRAMLFERPGGGYAAFLRHYLPEDTIEDGTNENSNRYMAWHKAGWITATPGNITDFEFIEEDLLDDLRRFDVQDVAYDPFQATRFATTMLDAGAPMVEYGQTVRNFSEPMKTLEAWIISKQIVFQWDPVTLWAMGNVVARLDAKDNVFPRKERDAAKIDPVVALIMAVGRALEYQDDDSDYSVVTVA